MNTANLPVVPSRRMFWILCVALIGIHVARVVQIVPGWAAGQAPAYPRQYAQRLLNALGGIGLVGAVLVGQSSLKPTARGRVAYWGLLTLAVAALVGQVVTDT
jgi:hypothetical protein